MSKRKVPSGVELRKEPKQERSRQTYQVILQGAAKLIRRDGIKKFSTNKVAEETGVSIGSLYQYFPSKQAIVAALIDQNFEIEYNRMKDKLESLSEVTSARSVLMEVLSHYYRIEPEDLKYRRALVELVATVEKTNEALRFHRSMGEMILRFLNSKFKAGPAKVDPETVVFMLTYMLRATVLSSVDPNLEKVNRESLMDEITGFWLQLLRRSPEADSFQP